MGALARAFIKLPEPRRMRLSILAFILTHVRRCAAGASSWAGCWGRGTLNSGFFFCHARSSLCIHTATSTCEVVGRGCAIWSFGTLIMVPSPPVRQTGQCSTGKAGAVRGSLGPAPRALPWQRPDRVRSAPRRPPERRRLRCLPSGRHAVLLLAAPGAPMGACPSERRLLLLPTGMAAARPEAAPRCSARLLRRLLPVAAPGAPMGAPGARAAPWLLPAGAPMGARPEAAGAAAVLLLAAPSM